MVAFFRRGMRFHFIVAALLVGALLGASAARANDMQEANALLKAHQYSQALEHVDKVLAAKPGDPQARFLKGLILTEQGDSKDAIEVFEQLTRDYPDLPEPYNNLAVIYARQGHYEKAREALEKSIRTHSSYATAYENLGDIYARLASQAYDKALQLDSTNSGAQSKLMLVRSIVGLPPQPARTAQGKVTKPVAVASASTPAAPAPLVGQGAAPEASKQAIAPTPKPAAKHVSDPRRAVLEAVQAWARAWSGQDVDAYLSHYAPDFKTPHGASRRAWEALRRSRVGGPKSIAVTIKTPKVMLESDAKARVTFHQIYRSNRFSASSRKTLDMVKVGQEWLIQREQVGG